MNISSTAGDPAPILPGEEEHHHFPMFSHLLAHEQPTYHGHRRESYMAQDPAELVELRARFRTFQGAYARTGMVVLGSAGGILKIFDKRFYSIGILFTALSLLILLIALLRSRRSDRDFADAMGATALHEQEAHLVTDPEVIQPPSQPGSTPHSRSGSEEGLRRRRSVLDLEGLRKIQDRVGSIFKEEARAREAINHARRRSKVAAGSVSRPMSGIQEEGFETEWGTSSFLTDFTGDRYRTATPRIEESISPAQSVRGRSDSVRSGAWTPTGAMAQSQQLSVREGSRTGMSRRSSADGEHKNQAKEERIFGRPFVTSGNEVALLAAVVIGMEIALGVLLLVI